MSGSCLLDTNIVIALLAQDELVLNALKIIDEIYIPAIVVGELYYGAYKSQRTNENLETIRRFANENAILGMDATTGFFYGRVKSELKRTGSPIPENDIWIAALGLQYDHLIFNS